MTADLSWLPDEPISLFDFRGRLSAQVGHDVDRAELNGAITTMRANGIISVTGDPREPSTMVVTKTARVTQERPPATRPEFHSVSGAAPDLRMDRVEHRLAELERRVAELRERA